jgi:hypothetical protein
MIFFLLSKPINAVGAKNGRQKWEAGLVTGADVEPEITT